MALHYHTKHQDLCFQSIYDAMPHDLITIKSHANFDLILHCVHVSSANEKCIPLSHDIDTHFKQSKYISTNYYRTDLSLVTKAHNIKKLHFLNFFTQSLTL